MAEHLLASSAVPALFPPIQIGGDDGRWYVDGGVRMNTPIKPALKLGATHIAIVAADPARHLPPPAGCPRPPVPPDADDAVLLFLQAAFVDALIEDVWRLGRTNSLLIEAAGAGKAGRAENQRLQEPIRIDGRDFDVVPYLFVGPNRRGVLGEAAARVPAEGLIDRSLRRLTGHQEAQHRELLSYTLFTPDFFDGAIALGDEDAAREIELARRRQDQGQGYWRTKPLPDDPE